MKKRPNVPSFIVVISLLLTLGIAITGCVAANSAGKNTNNVPSGTYKVLDVRETAHYTVIVLEDEESFRYIYKISINENDSVAIVPGDTVDVTGKEIALSK